MRPGAVGVYVCDLPPGLTEVELWQVFGHHGTIVSIERIDEAAEEAAAIEYTTLEAAEEARSIVNHAMVRGKTCRCILTSTLEVICRTMDSGHRLVIENLDPAVESRGLWDVSALFGVVLDCKVETDEKGRSRGIGFMHYSSKEEALKATTLLHRMQIGESVVEVRPYERKDAALFSGCLYAVGHLWASGAPAAAMLPPAAEHWTAYQPDLGGLEEVEQEWDGGH